MKLANAANELLPRLPLAIDWEAIWRMLADEDMQRAMSKFQSRLTKRREEERIAVAGTAGLDPAVKVTYSLGQR